MKQTNNLTANCFKNKFHSGVLYVSKNAQARKSRKTSDKFRYCHIISQYIDHHLQPDVKKWKSNVKDPNWLPQKINNVGKIPG